MSHIIAVNIARSIAAICVIAAMVAAVFLLAAVSSIATAAQHLLARKSPPAPASLFASAIAFAELRVQPPRINARSRGELIDPASKAIRHR